MNSIGIAIARQLHNYINLLCVHAGGLQSDDYIPNLSLSVIYGIALLQWGNYVCH